MSSFSQAVDKLESAISLAEEWTSPPVIIQVASSLSDDLENGAKKEIDLIPTLGHNVRHRSVHRTCSTAQDYDFLFK